MAQGDHQVTFAQTGGGNEDDVAVLGDEVQLEQVLHLGAVDPGGPVPVELLERLEHREARVLDAALHAAVGARGRFAAGQFAQVVQVRPLLVGRGVGDRTAVFAHERQVQFGQLRAQRVVALGIGGVYARASGRFRIVESLVPVVHRQVRLGHVELEQVARRVRVSAAGSGVRRWRAARMLAMYSALNACSSSPSSMARVSASRP
ncbi:MAG: hypothetical protein U1F07_10640 [Rubrivivax sp.]